MVRPVQPAEPATPVRVQQAVLTREMRALLAPTEQAVQPAAEMLARAAIRMQVDPKAEVRRATASTDPPARVVAVEQ
jgi:hypothetical protein